MSKKIIIAALAIFFAFVGSSFSQYDVNVRYEIPQEIAPDTIRAGDDITINVYLELTCAAPIALGFYYGLCFNGYDGVTEVSPISVVVDPGLSYIWDMGAWTEYGGWDGILPDSFAYSGITMVGWYPCSGEFLAFSFSTRVDQTGVFELEPSYWPEWYTTFYYDWFPPLFDPTPHQWTVIEYPMTFHVPGDFTTIQEAVDYAASGDTVYVAMGNYTGEGNRDIDFKGKEIVLMSEYGPDLTVIDCGGSGTESHRGFIFQSGEENGAIVDGFTIRGGMVTADPGPYHGGAILCDSSNPTIRHCKIDNNVAVHGAGISCVNGAAPDISFCIFTGNVSTEYGGGMACFGSSPVITNCTFARNYSAYIWENFGGGISCVDTCAPVLNNCIIALNIGGGAVKCEDHYSIPYLNCCDIFGNVGGDWAGLIANQILINGNMSADPLFVDGSRGLYYLDPESPCMPENNDCSELIGALGEMPVFVCGDFNSDDNVNILDITAMIAYLYKGGPPPANILAVDVNGSGEVNILDITYLISYLYKSGPEPECVSSSGASGIMTDHSGCGGYGDAAGRAFVDDTLDCIEYSYDGESVLNIIHRNAGLNCCPFWLYDISVQDSVIIITEPDSGQCLCLCLFDINYQITDLEPGVYTIRFVEPLISQGDEILEVTVDLISEPSDLYCVYRDQYPWGIY